MQTLCISHYIYLTKQQRYDLHDKKEIEVIGVSTPVWFDKGTTSEPAKELFVKYNLTNEEENKNISQTKDGYWINLPQEKNLDKSVLEKISSKNLLDIQDGGIEELSFRQYNTISYQNKKFNIIHFVEIKPIEFLTNSLS
jgi:hypothetical protein